MTPQGLTREQCLLLQRFYDEELRAAESIEAEQLLERSAAARVFVQALGELSAATRASHELLWERAEPHLADAGQLARMAEMAAKADQMLKAPLDELSGLLTRVHDGEADPAEAAWVRAMLQERDDARAYLDGLDEISKDLRALGDQMVEDVDFGGFWEKVSAGIDAEAAPTPETRRQSAPEFDPDAHLMLLHRFADGETTEAERAKVQAWIDAKVAEVVMYLAALDEIRFGVTVAAETACERAPLRDIWTGVVREIDAADDDEKAPGAPISLDDARRKRGGGWFGEYRQAIFGAVAAAVVLVGVVGLFKDQIFGPQERVIVEKTIEKRIVVVESVEYSPGSSVMIDSPMTRVNANKDDAKNAEPTVIWLFENDRPEDSQADEMPATDPPANSEDAAADDVESRPDYPDAFDAEPGPRGQPI